MVIGLAFLLAGLLIMFVPMSSDTPGGSPVSCGNALGIGFDQVEVEKIDPTFVGICERLRNERMGWALPMAIGGGVLLAAGGLVGRRRSRH
ncbi:hypothetical protein [Umezawaea sp.]|uniref:hypothetical protein n=1 Tax=Umezawaea sp. TaxID=1955258 RepID=UPI002ED3F41F